MARPYPASSTCGDLGRLLVGWLILIVLVQGCAAAHARALGPLHGHRAAGLDTRDASAAPLFTHRRAASEVPHTHDGWQRHHHHHADASVKAAPGSASESALDEAAVNAVLAFVYAALLPSAAIWRSADRRHVWSPAARWTASTRASMRPWHPPRG